MTYLRYALGSIPSGMWMLDERGTVDIADHSGHSREATLSYSFASATRPLVPGAENGMYMIYDTSITYPYIEVWEKYRSREAFTVEFWFLGTSTYGEYHVFQPYETAGDLQYNYIKVVDSEVVFSVSEISDGNATGQTYVVKAPIQDIKISHHIACVFTGRSISIVIDGIVKKEVIVNSLSFSHDLTGFKTYGGNDNYTLNALAIYRRAVPVGELKNHFNMGRKVMNPLDIVTYSMGDLIPLNSNNFYHTLSLRYPQFDDINDWDMHNIRVSNNKWTMKSYTPAEFYGGTPSYNTYLDLGADQYVVYPDVSNLLGGDFAVGGYWYVDSTIHNAVAEFTLMELYSGNKETIIGLYKDVAGDLVIRYKEFNSGTGQYDVSAYSIIGTASTYYDSFVYIYFTYDGADITTYVNTDTNSFTTDISSYSTFDISTNTSIYIGGTISGTNTWESQVHHIKLYSSISDIADFTLNKTPSEYGDFCLTLEDSLQVAQTGYATYFTNLAWHSTIGLSSIEFGPHTMNIDVYVSIDDFVTEYVATSGAPCPILVNGYDPAGPFYIKIKMQTVDSYNDIPVLDYLWLMLYEGTSIRSITNGDTVTPEGNWYIPPYDSNIIVGRRNNGLVLDGASSAVVNVDPNILSRTVHTVEFWMKSNGDNTSKAFFETIKSATSYKLFHGGTYVETLNLTAYINGQPLGATFNFSNEKWYHIVLVSSVDMGQVDPGIYTFGSLENGLSASNISVKNIAFYESQFTEDDALLNYNLYMGAGVDRVVEILGTWYLQMPAPPHLFGEQEFNAIFDSPPKLITTPWSIVSGS